MGCDIHMGFEKRRDVGWPWEAFAPSRTRNGVSLGYTGGRNYALFALLADVRNYYDITPLDRPRGYPADMSDRIRRSVNDESSFEADEEEFDGLPIGPPDGHSASWFTLKELLAVDRATPLLNADYATSMSTFWTLVDELKQHGEPDNVRIVFDFDN